MSWEYVSFWIENHSGLASWVQAVGSIAAILAAVWIASRDSRIARNEKNESRRNAAVRAEAAVKEAGLRAELANKCFEDVVVSTQISIVVTGLNQSLQHLTEAISSNAVDSLVSTQLFIARIALEDLILLTSVITPDMMWTEEAKISARKRLEMIEAAHAVIVSQG